jgi:hypothetical protein
LASAEPADPAPTMMKSTVRCSMGPLPPAGSAAYWWSMMFPENRYPLFGIMLCAKVTIEDGGCRGGRRD